MRFVRVEVMRVKPLDQINGLYICFLLILLAIALRILGINYGYWYADERINDAAKVLTGELIPGQHFYPPLFNYIMALSFAVVYAIGRLVPFWHDASEFRAQYFSDPTVFYLTARFITAVAGAAIAPLFYLIARSAGLGKWPSLAAGLLGAILPVSIHLSHIAKSDIPLATAVVLTFYLLLLKYKNTEDRRLDLLLGLSVSLAFSFKHSFIFIFIPLFIGHLYWLSRLCDRSAVMRSIALSAAACVASWLVFNIGVILDLQNFLVYQSIQSVMSLRESSTYLGGLTTWLRIATDNATGVTAVSTLLFLGFPAYLHSRYSGLLDKGPLTIFWISIAAGTVVVIMLTGERQQEGLWIPYFTAMHLFAALLIADLLASRDLRIRRAGTATLAAAVIFCLAGSAVVLRQALARPIAQDLAAYIAENFAERRIVTSFELRLPRQKEAQALELEREQRLAAKYAVELPERSPENLITESAPGAVFYVNMPIVFFGLEHADDAAMEGIVRAHAWPFQEDEWALDYWTRRGFSIFIVSHFKYHELESPSQLVRTFYTDMGRRCALTKRFEPAKPMFLEYPISVFDCGQNANQAD